MNKISEKIFRYNVIFQPEPEGGFTVIVPSLQGCVSYGKTLDEARKMVIDAIGGFVECMREDGEEIPLREIPRGTLMAILRESQISKENLLQKI